MDVGILPVQQPAARVPHHRRPDLAGAQAVQQLVLVVVEEAEIRLARDERPADLIHEGTVGLAVTVERERVLAEGKREGHQRRAPEAHRCPALELRLAQVAVVADLRAPRVVDQPFRTPYIGQGVQLAVERGVLAHALEQLGDELPEAHPVRVDGLVDAKFLQRRQDAVLRGLGQVEPGATGGAQLGDHLLVVRERHLHLDAGLRPKLRDELRRHVVRPADDAQHLAIVGVRCRGDE